MDTIGPHTLYHGDCLAIMPTLPAASIDLIFADLPYGVTACKWDSVIPLIPLWLNCERITRPKAATVLTATQPFAAALIMSNPRHFRHEWIWNKITGVGFQCAKYRPMQQHEHVLVFGDSGVTYHPEMTPLDKAQRYKCYGSSDTSPLKRNDGATRTRTHTYPKSILTIAAPAHAGRLHPTQKPIDLIRYLIRTYSQPGDTVCDPTMGSGTTGVAAAMEARRFIGIELDAAYYETARQRIGRNC